MNDREDGRNAWRVYGCLLIQFLDENVADGPPSIPAVGLIMGFIFGMDEHMCCSVGRLEHF